MSIEKMGRQTGFEPATLGTTSRCSNQLSYYRHNLMSLFLKMIKDSSTRKHAKNNRAFLTNYPTSDMMNLFLPLCYKLELLAYLMQARALFLMPLPKPVKRRLPITRFVRSTQMLEWFSSRITDYPSQLRWLVLKT